MRTHLLDIFKAGVAAADPGFAVSSYVADVQPPSHILSIGKAAIGMARAAMTAFPDRPCLIVTNPENVTDVAGATVLAGAHPVPDQSSAAAGQAVLDDLQALGAGDHLLALISGGGSALCVAPVEGVTLAQKAAVNEALLGAGLDIVAMNTVRQALSQIKGGGLLQAAAPAKVTTMVLSDVVGDDPRAVASGPTAAPLGTKTEARDILQGAGLWEACPPSVKAAFDKDSTPVIHGDGPILMVGSNTVSVQAMAQAAGPEAIVIDVPLEGDVSEAAADIVALAKGGTSGLWLMGGETTVVLHGDGRGGRNQEMALRVAKALSGFERPFMFLSGGTDGRDGPTDAAGGVVDNDTWGKIGPEAEALLANNDSHAALARADALLRIPATGTNVADLQILWVGEAR